MPKGLRLLAPATLLALATIPVPARAQDAAFLLGRAETTTLIVVHGDSVSARRGEGLVVPRANGWWRVGVNMAPRDSVRRARAAEIAAADSSPPAPIDPELTNKYGEPIGNEACFGHAIWAARLGAAPVLPDTICAADEQIGGQWFFTFVGPTVTTLYTTITGEYTYNFDRGLVVVPLDSIARTPVTTLDAGGDWIEHTLHDPRWAAEAKRCNRGYNREADLMESEEGDDSTGFGYIGTVITRGPGHWVLTRYYGASSEAARGFEWTCDLRIPIPSVVTGWDRLMVPMSVVKKRVAGAYDAFTSPRNAGKGLAIVLAGGDAHVVRTRGASLGAELGVVPLPDVGAVQDAPVTTMAQWAVGAAAGRWEKELAAALTDSVPVRHLRNPSR